MLQILFSSRNWKDTKHLDLIKQGNYRQGEKTALKIRDQLIKLSSDSFYSSSVTADKLNEDFIFSMLYITGNKRQSTRKISETLGFRKDKIIKKDFFEAVDTLYSSNNYNFIRYDFQRFNGGYAVHLNVNEKTSQNLNISFNYNSDEAAGLLLTSSIKI